MTGFPRPELLATPDWLAEQAGRPDLRIVDVRWRPDGSGAQVHAVGHIPGAVHLDWVTDLSEREGGGVVQLAGPEHVASALGRLGIGDGTSVVLYDDTMGLYASRAWWSLRAYGFDAARVLDGGFAAWQAAFRPLSSFTVLPEPATFTPRANPRIRLRASDIRELIASPDAIILDARAPAEYRGFQGNTRQLGHIPGAINVPVGAMVRGGSQVLRQPAELREQLTPAGLQRGRRIVCYDGSGIAGSRLAFVLSLLGHDDVAVYDGGWADWGERLDLPVER